MGMVHGSISSLHSNKEYSMTWERFGRAQWIFTHCKSWCPEGTILWFPVYGSI